MTQKYQKLKTLLQELFQLDQPDLDFGLYRVMHAKSAEVSQFLDNDLLPQVQAAFAEYKTADKSEIEKELAKVIAGIEAAGMDPAQSPKVADLRARLAGDAVDIGALESEVYDHLFSFFRRYYSEGDFLAKRVYKPGVYAIPYEGEEVTLHWANKDQYYIKTSEYLRDYAFRLRPEDQANPMRVHFRLVDAAEGEHGNVKPTEGRERRFKLAEAEPVAIEDGELVVRFTYQPDPARQKDLNAAAETALLATTEPALAEWVRELRNRHRRADGTDSDNTRLRVHLDRYTARNTFDYFIHKDLGAFLRRELDFYIKNEVMHLDDIESESAPRVEQYLSKIKVIRKIAGKVIAFLAQLEDFQKKLWLKKKFVVETQWCIRVGYIPDEFHTEIAANEAQRDEWIQLGFPDIPPSEKAEDSPSPLRGEGQGEGHNDPPSPLWGEGRGEGQTTHPPQTQFKSRTTEERNALLTSFARDMRQAPTDAEARLWFFLRDRRMAGFKFRRQHAIGRYIADFASVDGHLVIELDGGQHGDLFQAERDAQRTAELEGRGLRVLRFWNHEVVNETEAVLGRIYDVLQESPSPQPSPQGGEGAGGWLKAHPTLVVDTRHFDPAFTARLLEAIGDLDEQTDGVLFHSENFQALALMQARYREQVKCIYIDPPYNTGGDGFAYKDKYKHSSWAAFMFCRLVIARELQCDDGALFVSLDEHEVSSFRHLAANAYGEGAFITHCIWQKNYSPKSSAKRFSEDHDYIAVHAKSAATWAPSLLSRTIEQDRAYKNPDNDPRGPWKTSDLSARNPYSLGRYSVTTPSGRRIAGPPKGRYWSINKERFRELEADKRIWWGANKSSIPQLKRFLSEVKQGRVPQTLWLYKEVGHTQEAKQQLIDLISFATAEEVFGTPKPVRLVARVANIGATRRSFILDYFAGSGTTGHAVINLNREDGGCRKFILVEMGEHFDTVLLPRIKKVTFTPEWKDGKPERLATPEEAERSPRILKVVRLESYEDALNNLETRRTDRQQSLLDIPTAQGAGGLREQYLLRYMLDVETRGSQSLLNVQAFADPTAYKLKVKRPGSDESREVNVDLIESFNWLIGLTVKHIAAPQSFSAAFERDSEGRLRVVGRLKAVTPHPNPLPRGERGKTGEPVPGGERGFVGEDRFWFRTVTGTTPDGRRALVIWRKLTGEPEEDNLVLDEWFTKQGYSAKDSEFDLIYVNGGNNLENLKTPDDLWKVRLIEEDFLRLMFETEGV